MHRSQIIQHALLPIGQLSEEAQESSNKLIKKFHRENSRKNSKKNSMTNVFLRLMAASDPVISSLRKLPKKKAKELSKEARNLLVFSKSSTPTSSDSDSSTSASSESEPSEDEQEANSDDDSWGFF